MTDTGDRWAGLRALEYAGGGYFRVKAPKGVVSPTLHGPELLAEVRALLAERDALADANMGHAMDAVQALAERDEARTEVERLREEIADLKTVLREHGMQATADGSLVMCACCGAVSGE